MNSQQNNQIYAAVPVFELTGLGNLCSGLLMLTVSTLCVKNTTLMLHTMTNAYQPIFVFFGRDVADRVCYRMVICYTTSPN